MSTPSPRTRRIAALSTAPVAVLVAGLLVWQGSNAAFTSTTRNSGNNWSTGSVELTDDDNGVAAFNAEDLVPGATGEKCIVVTANTDVPGEVRGYVQNLDPSAQGLEKYIFLEVERGTGGSFNDCTGFEPEAGYETAGSLSLEALANSNTDFASGGASWEVEGTGGEAMTYRGSWSFDTEGLTQAQVNALEGGRTSIDLVWELQSSVPE